MCNPFSVYITIVKERGREGLSPPTFCKKDFSFCYSMKYVVSSKDEETEKKN